MVIIGVRTQWDRVGGEGVRDPGEICYGRVWRLLLNRLAIAPSPKMPIDAESPAPGLMEQPSSFAAELPPEELVFQLSQLTGPVPQLVSVPLVLVTSSVRGAGS